MKVVPEHFFQLYTIHARRDEYTLPWGSVYARFQGKTEETYEKIHAELLKLESESNPTSIMVDFEKAEMNAFENNFFACVYGSFFHLT